MINDCEMFLQQTYDQYLHKSMYNSFTEDQRKEFEYLIKKYKIRRSELYDKPYFE
ncbi:hypothetical protein [Parvicella tangerina]|uniref:Uncharacterized protein n=1 Tax=Parvicella tangerina TaxID=2829795 RepID=A0A916JN14_9FLAO|nr:hypothetical protein [Parvicella tangerina]CAG5082843.1 hypothetical protein CRYO30217_02024 [Parvicella tangerina]